MSVIRALVAAAVAALVSVPVYAAEMEPTVHLVEADGVTLHVRDMGEGSPVVLLSGGPGFAGDQMLSTAKVVAEKHRAILPDQRGTGKSELAQFDPADFSLAGAIVDLEAVRASLEIESWTIVGHSWGGLLSMAYAAEHPDRVDGMVLVGPAGIDSDFWVAFQQNAQSNLTADDMQAMQSIAPPTEQTYQGMVPVMRAMQRVMAPAMMADREHAALLIAELDEDAFNPLVTMALQPHLIEYDLKPGLNEFSKPVTIIQGDADPIGLETTQKILDTIEGSERVVIEDCGHWPFHERPEAYADAVREALAE